MAQTLQGKKVAVLATDGFEEVELTQPTEALKQAGATVEIVSLEPGRIRAWKFKDWGTEVAVDRTVDEVRADEYDALLLPGGVMNPDKLRTNPRAVGLVREMFGAGKPVAAICHGPWMLAEADVARGMRLTSYPSIKTDLTNAGADWTDAEVIVDRGLVTSRKPDDIPAFNAKMLEEFAEGRHGGDGRRETARATAAGR